MNNKSCQAPQDLVSTVLPPVLILELLLGLPGNTMALWIFCCRLQTWTSNTVYLLNLMLADFLLLGGVPLHINNLLRGENWVFGNALCSINLFMSAVNHSASIGFMTIVAVGHYFKVVHPHHRANRMTARDASLVAGAVWLVVVLVHLPLLGNDLLWRHGNQTLCRSFGSNGELMPGMWLQYLMYLAEFFLPFLLLVFCTVRITCALRLRGRDRGRVVRRAVQVVLLIVVVFTICFLPGAATGLATLYIRKYRPQDCEAYLLAGQIFSLSIGFTYLNSSLNPLIYCFSSCAFRNTLKSSLKSLGVFRLSLNCKNSPTRDR